VCHRSRANDDPRGNLFWVVRRFVGVDDPQKNLFWVVRRFVGADVPPG